MIVKFFKASGKGSSSGVMDYMLGKDRKREEASIIKGSEEITTALIDQSLYARTYTSGCLSFSEEDIPLEVKQKLIDSFESTLMSGLEKDQYNFLWIEHRDKGRLELNFVIPNIELTSGKRLQPFYSRADKPLVNAWKDMQNQKYGFSDPNDPLNKQFTAIKDQALPKTAKQIKEDISLGLEHLIIHGDVSNRDEAIEAITEAGYNVVRVTEKSISIANPDGGRNIRLKGFIYEQSGRDYSENAELLKTASEQYGARAFERNRESAKIYSRGIAAKREYHQKRYPAERELLPRRDSEPREKVSEISVRNMEDVLDRNSYIDSSVIDDSRGTWVEDQCSNKQYRKPGSGGGKARENSFGTIEGDEFIIDVLQRCEERQSRALSVYTCNERSESDGESEWEVYRSNRSEKYVISVEKKDIEDDQSSFVGIIEEFRSPLQEYVRRAYERYREARERIFEGFRAVSERFRANEEEYRTIAETNADLEQRNERVIVEDNKFRSKMDLQGKETDTYDYDPF